MSLSPEQRRVLVTYQGSTTRVRTQTLAFVSSVWASLDNYRDAEIERFARTVAPVVQGGQVTVAALTSRYMAALTGTTAIGVPRGLVVDVRGVSAAEVYARTGPTVWSALSRGVAPPEAFRMGLQRGRTMAATDLQLAKTHASREVLRAVEVTRYQRVPGGADPCDLCILAAQNTYRSDLLLPIHNNCSCDVLPLGDNRRADTPSPSDGDGRAGDSGIEIEEHGELGPVLTVAGHSHTGPDDF